MAFRALLTNDLHTMVNSWAVRIWAILAAMQAIATLPLSMNEETPAQALANVLGVYPVIWSTFIVMISAGAVSSESGVVADSILSKAVTRYEYILAKMLARLLTVLGVYLLVALPSAFLVNRYAESGEIAGGGIAWAIGLIALVMALLTSLSVTFSALFNRTVVAVMVAWFLWYLVGGIFALIELEHLSPLHIVDNLPAVIQGDYSAVDRWETLGVFGLACTGVIALAVSHFARKDL